jgi:glycosyltransferase 2 family protein
MSEVTPAAGLTRQLARRGLLLFAVAVVVYAGLALFADAPKLLDALAAFQWAALPVAILLTLGNYGLRFVKWQYFLRVLGFAVPWRTSLLIFLVGLGMAVTPGKAGELVKSHLLRERQGIAISVSVPLLVADRLTDVFAMLILAFGGLVSREGGPLLAALIVASGLGATQLLRWQRGAEWALGLAGRLPVLKKRQPELRALYESSVRLLSPRPLAVMTLLSTIAWWAECVALLVILLGLGQPASWPLLLTATSSYALSTLIGAISFLPGGLGAQEVSLASLLLLSSAGISREEATFATILVRLVTFWFGIAIGLTALGIALRETGPRPEPER